MNFIAKERELKRWGRRGGLSFELGKVYVQT